MQPQVRRAGNGIVECTLTWIPDMKSHRFSLSLLFACALLVASPDPALAADPDGAQRVSFQTIDRVNIAGLYHPVGTTDELRPAVLLMHGGNQSKMTWVEVGLFEALVEQGYHVLSIDIRGRGDSGVGYEVELKRNPAIAQRDLVAGLEFLLAQPGVDPENLAMIGSSYGSNLIASWMMSNDGAIDINTIVCLSATAVLFHFPPAHADAAQHQIHCSGLYVASDNEIERYKADETAQRLADETAGNSEVKIYEGRAHAARLLQHVEGSTELVLDWLDQEFD